MNMEPKKIGTYSGKPASLVLLEESLGRAKSLYQYHCKCGDKFFSLIYALLHCEKKHVGQSIEDNIKYQMILRRDLMQALYDAASINIAQESENQLQKRLEAESVKHQQELRELEKRLRAQIKSEKVEEKKVQKMQEFSMKKVKAEPMSPVRDSESYSDHASIASGMVMDFGFSDLKSVNYQPKPKTPNGSPIPVLGQKPNFNARSYYNSFEQDIEENSTVSTKLGKRPRESMDSGCGMSPDPAEKRALIEEETKDPVTGTTSFTKLVIPITMSKLASKLPKKPVIMREYGCQTEPEPKEPKKIMKSSGAQSSPTVVTTGTQCKREKSLYEFLGLRSIEIRIPHKVPANRCAPSDPRKERREAELSIYHSRHNVISDIAVLPGIKVCSSVESQLIQKSEEEKSLEDEILTGAKQAEPRKRMELPAKISCEINVSSSTSMCTATPSTVDSTPQSPDDEPPARFLVSQKQPRTPLYEPISPVNCPETRIGGPRTPPPQPVPPPASFHPYNGPYRSNSWPGMPVFFPSMPPLVLSRPPPPPDLEYYKWVPPPPVPPQFVPPPPAEPATLDSLPMKNQLEHDDNTEVAMDLDESFEEPGLDQDMTKTLEFRDHLAELVIPEPQDRTEHLSTEPPVHSEEIEEEVDIKPTITPGLLNPANDAIFLLQQFIQKFKKS